MICNDFKLIQLNVSIILNTFIILLIGLIIIINNDITLYVQQFLDIPR